MEETRLLRKVKEMAKIDNVRDGVLHCSLHAEESGLVLLSLWDSERQAREAGVYVGVALTATQENQLDVAAEELAKLAKPSTLSEEEKKRRRETWEKRAFGVKSPTQRRCNGCSELFVEEPGQLPSNCSALSGFCESCREGILKAEGELDQEGRR